MFTDMQDYTLEYLMIRRPHLAFFFKGVSSLSHCSLTFEHWSMWLFSFFFFSFIRKTYG